MTFELHKPTNDGVFFIVVDHNMLYYPTVLDIVQKARESHDIVQLVIVQYRVTLLVFFQVTEKG